MLLTLLETMSVHLKYLSSIWEGARTYRTVSVGATEVVVVVGVTRVLFICIVVITLVEVVVIVVTLTEVDMLR